MSRLPPLWLVGLTVVATLLIAVSLPLATYTITLAVFGLAHVFAELRYVDQRFGQRVAMPIAFGLGGLLCALVTTRTLLLVGVIGSTTAVSIELGLGMALAACVLKPLWDAGPVRFAIGGGVTVALLAGLIASPLHALVLIAVLHNFTPLGFLAERFEGTERTQVLAVAFAAMVGVPLIIASGLPTRALASAGWLFADAGPLTDGPVNQYMGSYLPREWVWEPFALQLFSAAVFAQCMHYAVVIHVLPRLADGPSIVPWPEGWRFWTIVAGITLILAGAYLQSFNQGKAIYAVAAAVHAWIEVPLLLLAMALPFTAVSATGKDVPAQSAK